MFVDNRICNLRYKRQGANSVVGWLSDRPCYLARDGKLWCSAKGADFVDKIGLDFEFLEIKMLTGLG